MLKSRMFGAAAGLALLAAAGAAHAITPAQLLVRLSSPPPPPSGLTVNFGANTPSGYGLAYFGLKPGSFSIVSQSVPCSTGSHPTFVVGGNGGVVPNDSGYHNLPDTTYYGKPGAAAGLSGTCTLVLKVGSRLATDYVNLQPNATTVTPKPYAAKNPDTNSNWELANVVKFTGAQNLALGQTIYIRDGQYNPAPSASLGGSARYTLSIPNPASTAGNTYAWSGSSGVLTIACDHSDSSADVYGNPVRGGGCKLAEVLVSPAVADQYAPLKFQDVSLYTDYAGPEGVFTAGLMSFSNNVHGLSFDRVHCEYGPDVVNANTIGCIIFQYTGADTPANATLHVTNSYFTHAAYLLQASSGMTAHCATLDSENNVFNGALARSMIINATCPSLLTGNLIFGGFGVGPSIHADAVLIQGTTIDGGVHQGPTITKNIIVHGDPTFSSIGTLTPISYVGTLANGAWNNNSNGYPVTGGSGKYAYVDLQVSGCPDACAFSGVYHPVAGGTTQGAGRGYKVGDIVTVAAPDAGATFTFRVASVGGSQDSLGFYFDANGTDTVSGVVIRNNFVSTTDGDQILGGGLISPQVNYNDVPGDFTSNPLGANGGMVGSVPLRGSSSAGNGGSFDRNVANAYVISTQPGSPTCYPGTPPYCPTAVVPQSLAAYQAIWPGYSVNGPFNRQAILAHQTPAAGGAGLNPDGTYRTMLFPATAGNSIGAWNDGSVYAPDDPSWVAAHPPAS